MTQTTQTAAYPNAGFWDRIAKCYSKKSVPDQRVYEAKLERTTGYLRPTDIILEIGCGTGTTAIHLSRQVESIRATDISEQMIEIARMKARTGQIDNVPFDVESAGLINSEPRYIQRGSGTQRPAPGR
jgi:ubiquinone/menaquinone biosynthesis C-methylase UbiE